MTRLRDVTIESILPHVLRDDPETLRVVRAIQPYLRDTVRLADGSDIWSAFSDLPASLSRLPDMRILDHLAWSFGVSPWDVSWPASRRARLIRGAIERKRRAGTIAAIESVVSAIGHASCVTPWYADPLGAADPYTLDILVFASALEIEFGQSEQVVLDRAIRAAKAARTYYTLTIAVSTSGAIGLYSTTRTMGVARLDGRAVIAFNPLYLEPAIWLDPTDASTLFVDAEGTIPCVPSDPVGLWKNKGTAGSAGDFVQTISAQRPIYDGESVLFDGGGSRLASSYTPTLPSSLFANVDLFGPPPTGGSHRIFATTTALPYIQIGDVANGMNATFMQSGLSSTLPNTGGRAIKTIGGEWSTARFRSYVGACFVDSPVTPTTNFTAAGPWNINLNGNVQQRVGHVFISNRTLTDDERGELITWLEQRA